MNTPPVNLTTLSKPFVLWFTGLSGAGKSTLAQAVNQILAESQHRTHLLDGDTIRQGLCADLSFSDVDRTENIRRVSESARMLVDSGCIVVAALISPKRSHRQTMRDQFENKQFIEVFVDTSLEECERRDVKGLYKKARAGELKNFTGIDSQYEKPKCPDVHIKTEMQSFEHSVDDVMNYLLSKGYINS